MANSLLTLAHLLQPTAATLNLRTFPGYAVLLTMGLSLHMPFSLPAILRSRSHSHSCLPALLLCHYIRGTFPKLLVGRLSLLYASTCSPLPFYSSSHSGVDCLWPAALSELQAPGGQTDTLRLIHSWLAMSVRAAAALTSCLLQAFLLT